MPRLVKRYGNRKLYDTSESRYVTLEEIARWVRAGEEVRILENDTGEDLTAITFAQIILEEERRKSGLLSLPVLREIIRHGESALKGLAQTVDRGVEAIRSAPERAGRRVQEEVGERLGKLGRLLDETMRGSLERVTALPAFQKEMRRIERSIRALEARITRLRMGTEHAPAAPREDQPAADRGDEVRSGKL
jgi:polyhydroxyalkanoate synthesis repressor PhaR